MMIGSNWSLLLLLLIITVSGAFRPPQHAFRPRRVFTQTSARNQRRPTCGVVRLRAAGDSEEPDGRRRFFSRLMHLSMLSAACAERAAVAEDVPNIPPRRSLGEIGSRTLVMRPPEPDGMGMPDVSFPGPMQGQWRVTRVLTGVEFPKGRNAVDKEVADRMMGQKGIQHDVFPVRFIENKALVPLGVVQDRGYNTVGLVKASEGVDVSVKWQKATPDSISISYPGSASRNSQVRKRETTREGKVVEWTELYEDTTKNEGGAQQVSARFVNSRVIVARWLSEPNGKILNAEVAYGVCIEYFLPSSKKYLTGDWMAAPKDDATMKLTWRTTFERPCSEEPRSKVCIPEASINPSPTLDQVQKMIVDTNSGFQTQRKKEKKNSKSNGYVFF